MGTYDDQRREHLRTSHWPVGGIHWRNSFRQSIGVTPKADAVVSQFLASFVITCEHRGAYFAPVFMRMCLYLSFLTAVFFSFFDDAESLA